MKFAEYVNCDATALAEHVASQLAHQLEQAQPWFQRLPAMVSRELD
jgi:hypothetical protein